MDIREHKNLANQITPSSENEIAKKFVNKMLEEYKKLIKGILTVSQKSNNEQER